MADGGAASGRIRREDADQVLIGAMLCVACSLYDDANQQTALHLMERALPLASASTRITALTPVADRVLRAAPFRRKRGEAAHDWLRAMMDLRVALSRDALRVALARVEV
jgi:hypothetical protein